MIHMNNIILTFLIFLFTACVPSGDTVNQQNSSYAAPEATATSSSGDSSSNNSTSSTSSTNSSFVEYLTYSQLPETVSDCSFSSNGTDNFAVTDNTVFGDYTICQDSAQEKDIYIQFATTQATQLCLIPLYQSSNKAIHLGTAKCLYASDPQTIYKVSLTKDRSSYSSYPINALMVLKNKSYSFGAPFTNADSLNALNAFYDCMNILNLYGNDSYCNEFKNSAEYILQYFDPSVIPTPTPVVYTTKSVDYEFYPFATGEYTEENPRKLQIEITLAATDEEPEEVYYAYATLHTNCGEYFFFLNFTSVPENISIAENTGKTVRLKKAKLKNLTRTIYRVIVPLSDISILSSTPIQRSISSVKVKIKHNNLNSSVWYYDSEQPTAPAGTYYKK